MTIPNQEEPDRAWERFVIAHGHRAIARELAFILGRTEREILRMRASGACTKSKGPKNYPELFALWHGREPGEDDWPSPRKRKSGH